jgi:hypothetical protein
LSDDQREEIADAVRRGESYNSLARKYDCSAKLIAKTAKQLGAEKPPPKKAFDGRAITEFSKRAKSILWRQEKGKEHPSYDKWVERVGSLIDGAGMKKNEAIIQASKDFTCLRQLFREYDVTQFDPHPESHPGIKKHGEKKQIEQVACENIKQSYRDSLRWAITAAGKHLRTGVGPSKVPCDAAWWLYQQAIEEPKDFMAKVSQIEAKADAEYEAERMARQVGTKSMAEIDEMLSELDRQENEDEAKYDAELQAKAAKALATATARRVGIETEEAEEVKDPASGD